MALRAIRPGRPGYGATRHTPGPVGYGHTVPIRLRKPAPILVRALRAARHLDAPARTERRILPTTTGVANGYLQRRRGESWGAVGSRGTVGYTGHRRLRGPPWAAAGRNGVRGPPCCRSARGAVGRRGPPWAVGRRGAVAPSVTRSTVGYTGHRRLRGPP